MGVRVEYRAGYKFPDTRLTFIKETEPSVYSCGQKQRRALMECDCGETKDILINSVASCRTTSCGCVDAEKRLERNTKHGACGTKEYRTYNGMLDRCFNKKSSIYSYYGGRGISVCDRWVGENGFVNFKEDVGDIPKGMSLDRIDYDGDYTPENCRVTNQGEQNYNKRATGKNKVGKTGVGKVKDTPNYFAFIGYGGKRIHLITTPDYELAVFCREEAEVHYYGYKLKH